MPQLLEYFPLKALARILRASFHKLPFKADAGTLVPDEVAPMDIHSEPVPVEDPTALEARILEILRVASKVPSGELRSDALAEVTRLRQQAIELRRRTAARLKAQIAAKHRETTRSSAEVNSAHVHIR